MFNIVKEVVEIEGFLLSVFEEFVDQKNRRIEREIDVGFRVSK